MEFPSRTLVLLSLLTACEQTSHTEQPPVTSAVPPPAPPVRGPDASGRTDAVAPELPAVDPGNFQRFGCATDAMPPHIARGTARVRWTPRQGQGFHFRNVPARCGGAYPGQMVAGARTRPGDGAEFVVCMPEERRVDLGILRRGPVSPGAIDVLHTENVVRLRVLLDRYVNVVAPAGTTTPEARLVLGPRLRTASGSVSLATSPSGPAAGTLEFEIDCSR